ncbi:beta-ketoacyl-ACP synthase [Acinetobacter rudis]|uniref:beta-ketoacyl-ACP synthase n=1 Tax=Acinetobacter rudis TaxID=632955 RepID=UPI00333E8E43
MIKNICAPAVGIQFHAGLSAVGETPQQLQQHLSSSASCLSSVTGYIAGQQHWVGAYTQALYTHVPADLHDYDSRNLRFALTALQQIEQPLRTYVAQFDSRRLAVIIGTSTSGIADNEPLIQQHFEQQSAQVSHQKQEMGCLAKALKQYLGWQGIAYSVSTACASSAKAMAAGQRLLNAGLADAVLVGGVDSLCRLTLNGFSSLESLSAAICQPCGITRDGINIGEAAGLFLLSKESAAVMLLAAGESMDAWHISAPHPEGVGAAQAMQAALDMAGLSADQIGYLNLHGTATRQNDAMEAKAVAHVFQDYPVPLSSTKHQTGHCLGAAGAIEAHICVQLLKDQTWLPMHMDTQIDPELAGLNYVRHAQLEQTVTYAMSNSFAFGGSNISLIFGTQVPCSMP